MHSFDFISVVDLRFCNSTIINLYWYISQAYLIRIKSKM